jgi:F0F1-type ATP synthase membrane subunit b/b'
MSYKSCGCTYGACCCDPMDERTDEEKRIDALNSGASKIETLFKEMNRKILDLETENNYLNDQLGKSFEDALKEAKTERIDILKEANKEANKIIKEAVKISELRKEFRTTIKKSNLTRSELSWVIAIMAELDFSEMLEILKEELTTRQ